MSFEISKYVDKANIPESETWISEALFGLRYINRYCESLGDGSAVLEIGCGSGILLCMLKESFPNLEFEGIEPFGSGFASLRDFDQVVRSFGINITGCAYETFRAEKAYDLIFCVNVFEHVDDWKDFLCSVGRWLSQNGTLVILCPNYGFPYESHFHIPVLLNKRFTYRIFKKYIGKFEASHDSEGLWNSLNFVSKKAVMQFIASVPNLDLVDRREIFEEMLGRLSTDDIFRHRQGLAGRLAKAFQTLGLVKIFKFFPNQLPYMQLEVKRTTDNKGWS